MTTLTDAILQANGDRELIQQAILAHAQAGKQPANDNHDGIETDAQFIADWTRWVNRPRGFTAYMRTMDREEYQKFISQNITTGGYASPTNGDPLE